MILGLNRYMTPLIDPQTSMIFRSIPAIRLGVSHLQDAMIVGNIGAPLRGFDDDDDPEVDLGLESDFIKSDEPKNRAVADEETGESTDSTAESVFIAE